MSKYIRRGIALAGLTFMAAAPASATGLKGSRSSMHQQHEVAVAQDYTFLSSAAQLRAFIKEGRLEPLEGNADYALSKVSFPYARPEVRLFIERLAMQYHAATGFKLVVTSLTRPTSVQPRNAHKLSVHPAGMAVDLRIPATSERRAWLEQALLSLEGAKVLDVTRERRPPHYHVAVFPEAYMTYVGKQNAQAENALVFAGAIMLAPQMLASQAGNGGMIDISANTLLLAKSHLGIIASLGAMVLLLGYYFRIRLLRVRQQIK